MKKNLALALASLVTFFTAAELLCRVVRPDERWFKDPYANDLTLFRFLRYDAALGWTGRPGAKIMHLEERLNARGLRGPDFSDEKPPGVVRIVAMGDSCTFNVQFADVNRKVPLIALNDPVPALLSRLLATQDTPGRRFEIINAGVLGYSTLQGVRYLRRDVRRWHPDVILIRYGWNDHWAREPGLGIRPEPRNGALRRIYWQLLQSRLYAFMKRLIATALGPTNFAHPAEKPVPMGGAPPTSAMRVPPDEFVFNLRLMIREARAEGARVILMNAPMGTAVESFLRSKSLRPFLRSLGYGSLEDIFRVHRRYNALSAKVAREEDVPFIDLDAAFAARGRAALFGPTEVIHSNGEGNRLIAEMIFEELRRLGIVRPAG
jgi:lysophospholipase L1-like esterase